MDFEIGEVVYSDTKKDFFSICNILNNSIFGSWHNGPIGVLESKYLFRKTSYYEWLIKNSIL